jgi:UDP-N-acetylglucosamine--N-acetylmuramyl-(pentapeptide) pyrophosphoryl-undecaprenol N-acetylglucosamine transferase
MPLLTVVLLLTSLLVASTGGHLTELMMLQHRLSLPVDEVRWVTFDTAQSRSLLAGADVTYVPFVRSRDPINLARNLPIAASVLRDSTISFLVSAGASVALPYFLLARLRGIRCCYIESSARAEGPSVTGRLMGRIPGVSLYAQYPGWKNQRWSYGGSVFDVYEPLPPSEGLDGFRKVVVTVGTSRGYGFRRLIERLVEVLPRDAEVLWQTGDTDTAGLGISGHVEIPSAELAGAMADADLVIAHAGIGSAVAAFEAGQRPLLVPRRLAFREHVDDHQTQIAEYLVARGLAVSSDADDLTLSLLMTAARRQIAKRTPPPFKLEAALRPG